MSYDGYFINARDNCSYKINRLKLSYTPPMELYDLKPFLIF